MVKQSKNSEQKNTKNRFDKNDIYIFFRTSKSDKITNPIFTKWKKNIWTEFIEENEEFFVFVFVYKINVYKIN